MLQALPHRRMQEDPMAKTTPLTIANLKRAIEGRNGRALSDFYASNAVLRVIDRDHPPSKPNSIKGKKAISAYFNDVCGRNISHKLVSSIADKKRIAFTQNCTYPDGNKVFCSAMIDLKGGKIARQTVVQAWDE
jgi:hypothetical protein